MARCRYCKAKVSYQAKACPKCGCPNPGRSPSHHTTSDYSIEDSPSYILFSLIVTIVSSISAYVGWKDGGFWEAGKYWLLGGGAGLIIGYLAMMTIPDEIAEKINIAIGIIVLGFFGWLFFW